MVHEGTKWGEIPRIPTAEKRFLHVESVYVGQNK